MKMKIVYQNLIFSPPPPSNTKFLPPPGPTPAEIGTKLCECIVESNMGNIFSKFMFSITYTSYLIKTQKK